MCSENVPISPILQTLRTYVFKEIQASYFMELTLYDDCKTSFVVIRKESSSHCLENERREVKQARCVGLGHHELPPL